MIIPSIMTVMYNRIVEDMGNTSYYNLELRALHGSYLERVMISGILITVHVHALYFQVDGCYNFFSASLQKNSSFT